VRTALAGLTLVSGLLVGLGAPSLAQDDPDALTGTLLQAEDMPDGFTSQGPEEGTDFDIDSGAFTQFGGERIVSQVWTSDTSGVIFDFRMEFPAAQDAIDYLAAAEATLSEADASGLAPVMFEDPVGEDGRHYFGVTEIDADRSITFDNYLFHVGPVAAKVFVGSVDLPQGEALRLAQKAVERMTAYGVDDGPSDPGADPAEDPGADTAEDPAADPVEDPAADPSDPTAALRALVPAAVSDACVPFNSGTAGELAALSCGTADGLIVYARMSDVAALREAFRVISAGMPRTGQTDSCAVGQYLGTYPGRGEAPLGMVACWQPPENDLVLFWTDDANLVLGGILAETTDQAALDALWGSVRIEAAPD
jgi:hypothetical protein